MWTWSEFASLKSALLFELLSAETCVSDDNIVWLIAYADDMPEHGFCSCTFLFLILRHLRHIKLSIWLSSVTWLGWKMGMGSSMNPKWPWNQSSKNEFYFHQRYTTEWRVSTVSETVLCNIFSFFFQKQIFRHHAMQNKQWITSQNLLSFAPVWKSESYCPMQDRTKEIATD